MTTKFQQNAIVQNGKRFAVWYSVNSEKSITIYEERYSYFRDLTGFNIVNNSDSMTDYFERSRFTLNEGDEYFEEAMKAAKAKEESREKRKAKRLERRKKEIEQAGETIKVKGQTFEVISKEAHPYYEDMTKYRLKKVGGRAKKIYQYSQSADGRRYCPLHAVANI